MVGPAGHIQFLRQPHQFRLPSESAGMSGSSWLLDREVKLSIRFFFHSFLHKFGGSKANDLGEDQADT